MLNRTHVGDCRATLRQLASDGVRVRCCVTSPPYFGLRDYGMTDQIGRERTLEEYVSTMVEVFRLVREVMTDDGTLWLNLGDSYASNPASGGQQSSRMTGGEHKRTPQVRRYERPCWLKPKDLCGIPWRVAFALQADGWYLRQDIIWHKPNPMPESVTDRCTKAHEYLFLLSKSERYYFDAAAISEPAIYAGKVVDTTRAPKANSASVDLHRTLPRGRKITTCERRNRRSVWTIGSEPYAEAHFATFPTALVDPCILAGSEVGDIVLDPFMGTGTVGLVAQDLGRRWIGCELNPAYVSLELKRTAQQAMLLGSAIDAEIAKGGK